MNFPVLQVCTPGDSIAHVIEDMREHVRYVRELRPVIGGHELTATQVERWAMRLEQAERDRRKLAAIDTAISTAQRAQGGE